MDPLIPRLRRVAALQRAGRLAEARALCDALLAEDPGGPRILHLAGLTALLARDYPGGAALLERAVAAGNRRPGCLADLGTALRACGRAAEAVPVLREAMERGGGQPRAVAALAGALDEAGRPGEAARLLADAIAADPEPGLQRSLGGILLAAGDAAAAEERFRAALDQAPGDQEARAGLARALAARDRAEEALPLFRELTAARPGDPELARDLGRCLQAAGRPGEAVEVLDRALARAPDDTRAFFLLGRARDAAGTMDSPFLERWLSLPGPVPPLVAAAATRHVLDRHEKNRPEDLEADPVLERLLARARVEDPTLESMLTRRRAALLAGEARAGQGWLCALADQCFVNEYCWQETPEETAAVEALEARLARWLGQGGAVEPAELALYACYRSLSGLFRDEDGLPEVPAGSPVAALLERQVLEPRTERGLATSLPRLTPIHDEVSRKVREQYEAHPYPRWREIPGVPGASVESVLTGLFPWLLRRPLAWPGAPRILVAGCGTGHHPIVTAQRFAGSSVLAIDLSLASLGYACRKTEEAGLGNIRYAQADILELNEPEEPFDIVESAGVLHHMADPLEGWRRLLPWLRPGGFMKIGLYSEAGRRPVVAARQLIQERGFDASAEGIRRCRVAIMGLDTDHPARPVAKRPDFYSTSTCRDLLFHVHEHRYTLPQLAAMVDALGLEFLGFELASRDSARRYRERFPQDGEMRDLSRWEAIEQEAPGTFSGMYLFWLRRPE